MITSPANPLAEHEAAVPYPLTGLTIPMGLVRRIVAHFNLATPHVGEGGFSNQDNGAAIAYLLTLGIAEHERRVAAEGQGVAVSGQPLPPADTEEEPLGPGSFRIGCVTVAMGNEPDRRITARDMGIVIEVLTLFQKSFEVPA